MLDAWRPPGDTEHLLLCKIRDDKAAFRAHPGTAHFCDFDRRAAFRVIETMIQVVERH